MEDKGVRPIENEVFGTIDNVLCMEQEREKFVGQSGRKKCGFERNLFKCQGSCLE